jgi:WD40 repeat protein
MLALKYKLKGHVGYTRGAAVSPDNELIATCGNDCTTKLWRAGTTQLVCTLPNPEGAVERVHFSRDSRLLVTGGWRNPPEDKDTRDHDTSEDDEGNSESDSKEKSQKERPILTIKVWELKLRDTQGGGDACAIMMEPPTVLHTLSMHSQQNYDYLKDLKISPDSSKLAVYSAERRKGPVIWDLKTGTRMRLSTDRFGAEGVTWSPNSRLLASGDYDWGVNVWCAETGRQLVDGLGEPEDECFLCAAFANNYQLIAAGSDNGDVVLYNLEGIGKSVQKRQVKPIRLKLEDQDRCVTHVQFSPKDTVLVAYTGEAACIWDVRTQTRLHVLTGMMLEEDMSMVGLTWSMQEETWRQPATEIMESLCVQDGAGVCVYGVCKVRVMNVYVNLCTNMCTYTPTKSLCVHQGEYVFVSMPLCCADAHARCTEHITVHACIPPPMCSNFHTLHTSRNFCLLHSKFLTSLYPACSLSLSLSLSLTQTLTPTVRPQETPRRDPG